MEYTACAITGHRPTRFKWKYNENNNGCKRLKRRLKEQLVQLYDRGVRRFNVVEILERGLEAGTISIPGALPGQPDGFKDVETITDYLNTFGVTAADRIRGQFTPLFDPASEPLSEEVLTINDYIRQQAGYSLYDAQLAVAEAVKRQLERKSVALIIAECGSGKSKIGSTALGTLHGLRASQQTSEIGRASCRERV